MKRRNKFLVFVLVFVVCIFVSGFYFLGSSYVHQKIRLQLEEQVANQISKTVSIEQISGNVLSGLKISKVVIYDLTPEKTRFFSTDSVEVTYRLYGLLFGKFLVTRLDIKRPEFNVQVNEKGEVNLTKLFPAPNPDVSSGIFQPLISHVRIENGIFNLEDKMRRLKISVNGISSSIQGPLGQWEHTGKLNVQDGFFEVNGVRTQIEEIQTQFSLVKDLRELKQMRIGFGGSTLTISGQANDLNDLDAEVNLDLDFQDLAKFYTNQIIEGKAQIHLSISSLAEKINGQLSATFPFLRTNGVEIRNVSTRAEFTRHRFRITEIVGELAGGKISGYAEVTQSNEGIKYHGLIDLVDSQATDFFPMIHDLRSFLRSNGKVDIHVLFEGNGLDPNDFQLTGGLVYDEADLNDIGIKVSQANWDIKSGFLVATANLDEALIRLDGPLGLADDRDIDLQITKIDVDKLSRIVRIPDLGGEGKLNGKISPSDLTAMFEIPKASLFNVPIGILTVQFQYRDEYVYINQGLLVKNNSQLVLKGKAHPIGKVPVDLVLSIEPLQIADYIRLVGHAYPIQGTATGKLILDNTLEHLNGRGVLEIVDAEAWGLKFDSLSLPLEIASYDAIIKDFELSSRSQTGILNAKVTDRLDYEIDFQSEPMRLHELLIARGLGEIELDASMILNAVGRGHTSEPHIDLTCDFIDVSFSRNPLPDVSLVGIFTKEILSFEGFGFDETCRIHGTVRMEKSNPYEIFVKGRNMDATSIFPIINPLLGNRFGGVADGRIEMTGKLVDPLTARMKMDLTKFEVSSDTRNLVSPDNEIVKLRYEGDVWYIDSLILASPRDSVPIVSMIDSSISPRHMEFKVKSNEFEIQNLTDLFPEIPIVFSGLARYSLNVTATEAEGNIEDPKYELSCSVPNLEVKTRHGILNVTKAKGQILYENDQLRIPAANFLLFGNQVQMWGTLPIFNQSTKLPSISDSITNDTKISIQSSSFQIGPLTRFFSEISELTGNLDLHAQIGNCLSQPSISAVVDLNQTSLKLFDFPVPVQDLSALISVSSMPSGQIRIITEKSNWKINDGFFSVGDAICNVNLVNFYPEIDSWILSISGDHANLADIFSYLMSVPQPSITGYTDMQLTVEGLGDRIDATTAKLICQNLNLRVANEEITEVEPLQFTFSDRKFQVTPIKLGQVQPATDFLSRNWIEISGEIDLDGNLNLQFNTDKLPLSVALAAGDLPNRINGVLNSQIHVSNHLRQPNIEAIWTIATDFKDGSPEFKGRITYLDQLFTIYETELVGYNNRLQLLGQIPVNLSLDRMKLSDRFLDLPINVQLNGGQVDLSFIASFFPEIDKNSGIADIDLRLAGTAARPYLDGIFSIENGSLRFVDTSLPISQGSIYAKAADGYIDVTNFTCYIGEGKFDAQMQLMTDGLYPTDFIVKKIVIQNADIADWGQSFLKERFGPEIGGKITASGVLDIPINKFVSRGVTDWTPQLLLPFNLQNVIAYAKSDVEIEELTLESLDYRVTNNKNINIALKDRELHVQSFLLTDVTDVTAVDPLKLEGRGFWELDGNLDFVMKMRDFDISFLSNLVPPEYPIRGKLNANLQINGTDANPKLTFEWFPAKSSALTIANAEIDDFSGEITYEDQVFQIGREFVTISIGSNRALLSGAVPFNFSIRDAIVSPLPRPIEGRIDFDIRTLDFLPMIFPQFGFIDGVGMCNITIGGSIDSPQLKGVTSLRGVAFRLPETYISVDRAQLEASFTNEGVTIRRLEGNLNGGKFVAGGSLGSRWLDVTEMNTWATLKDGCIFQNPQLYWVRCDRVDLTMIGDVIPTGEVRLPVVRGTVRVADGRYKRPWRELANEWINQESAGIQFEVLSDYPIIRHLRLDLDVIAPGNISMVSDLGDFNDIKVSVNGEVVGPIQRPVYNGRVNILEGEFQVFAIDHPFTIKDGSYGENTDPLRLKPYYEIYAETSEPIRSVSLRNLDTKDVKVKLHMSGYLNESHNPTLEVEVLNSEIGDNYQLTLTQMEILSILTFGDTESLSLTDVGTMSNSGREVMLRQGERFVGNSVARLAGLREARVNLTDPLNLESRSDLFLADRDFMVDPLLDLRNDFLLTLDDPISAIDPSGQIESTGLKEISKRLAITYSNKISYLNKLSENTPYIEVEYQINKHMSVAGERYRINQSTERYGIDLKLELEF